MHFSIFSLFNKFVNPIITSADVRKVYKLEFHIIFKTLELIILYIKFSYKIYFLKCKSNIWIKYINSLRLSLEFNKKKYL